MIKFKPGKEVITKEPVIVAAPGLEPGMHRFQLVVVDDRGRKSLPTFHYILLFRQKPALGTKKEAGNIMKRTSQKRPNVGLDQGKKPKRSSNR